MGFPRQEYWSGLPFPSPGYLPDPGIEPRSSALQADCLPSEPPGKPNKVHNTCNALESSRNHPSIPVSMEKLSSRKLVLAAKKFEAHWIGGLWADTDDGGPSLGASARPCELLDRIPQVGWLRQHQVTVRADARDQGACRAGFCRPSPLGLQVVASSLCLHRASSLCANILVPLSLLKRSLVLLGEALTFITSLNLNSLQIWASLVAQG